MPNLQGFPYFEIEFNQQGVASKQAQVQALTTGLSQAAPSDLFVISHGWNNDMDDARDLYARFFACMRDALGSNLVPSVSKRTFAILAVLWPSKKFADKDLTPGQSASLKPPEPSDAIRQDLEALKIIFNEPKQQAVLDQAQELVSSLEASPEAQRAFVDLLRSLLTPETSPDEASIAAFFDLPGEQVIDRLSQPLPGAAESKGLVGGSQLFGGVLSGALNVLNLTTYYEMKERAGVIGSRGLNPLLQSIQARMPALRLHLIGHSFGGRLVTAAAAGLGQKSTIRVQTMALLQAAFSHYGFAQKYDGTNNGFFRSVILNKAVAGPIIISCTRNDLAVGTMYPLASMLAGQVGSFGDQDSEYGGLGANGAQKTPEARDARLANVSTPYHFQPGALHNLNADAIIQGHSDICHTEVAYAILNAVALS